MANYKKQLVRKFEQMRLDSNDDMEYLIYFQDHDKDFVEKGVNAIYDCRITATLKNYQVAGKISKKLQNELKREYFDLFRPRDYTTYRENKEIFKQIMGKRREEIMRAKHEKVVVLSKFHSKVKDGVELQDTNPIISSNDDRRKYVPNTAIVKNSSISKAIRDDFLKSLNDDTFRTEVIEALSPEIEAIVIETITHRLRKE